MVSPRLLSLSQPKRSHDPSMNDAVNNIGIDSSKPLWRSTRELCDARGLPTVYPRSRNYHEERFGWRSGYWIMWDTHPTGTKNSLKLAPDDIKKRAAFSAIRPRKHDDPCKMQRECRPPTPPPTHHHHHPARMQAQRGRQTCTERTPAAAAVQLLPRLTLAGDVVFCSLPDLTYEQCAAGLGARGLGLESFTGLAGSDLKVQLRLLSLRQAEHHPQDTAIE